MKKIFNHAADSEVKLDSNEPQQQQPHQQQKQLGKIHNKVARNATSDNLKLSRPKH
jgi:hypothetical protein